VPSNDYALITCPQCKRSLPPKMANCQFCGASLSTVARPVQAQKKIGPEPWVWTLYYVVACWWLVDALKELITSFSALAGIQAHPSLAAFAFIVYIGIAVGLFEAALGIGLLVKWEWARAVVNFFCWVRILFGVMGLYSSIMMAGFSGPANTALNILFCVLNIVMAGLQIWLISETDYSFMR
jgi:hypothetical protein